MEVTNVQTTENKIGSLPVIGIETSLGKCNEGRADHIAEAAYFKAQARGFEPGHEMDDWFAAEAEEAK